MIDIPEKKRKILEFLETSGPSLPVQIARTIKMDPVFASAILSELLSSKQIKTSHMRIGASPLYLIPGQENKLENKTEHLKTIEKETQEYLKSQKILYDDKEEPATRVALRNIKDFAIPFKLKEKILWKYAFTPQKEIDELIFPKEKTDSHFKNYFIYKFSERNKEDVYKNIKKLENEYGNGFVYDRDLKIEGESREDIIIKFKNKIKEFSETTPEMKFIIDYTHGLGRLMKMELEEAKKYGFKIIELNKKIPSKINSESDVPKAWKIKKEEIKQIKKKSKEPENIFEKKEPKEPKSFLKKIESFLESKNTKTTSIEEVDKKKVILIVKSNEETSMLFAFNKARITETELLKCYKEADKKNLPYQIITKASLTKKLTDTIRAYQKLLKVYKLEN